MGSHPINLLLRFLLEMTALLVLGIWGWKFGQGPFRFVLGFGFPILTAAIWGIFAVPNDPSRSVKAPIPILGSLRLFIEFLVFALSIWAVYDLEFIKLSWILGIIVLTHYGISFDRIIWLLKN